MTDTDEELDYETLERFAMAVESWPPDEAQAEYNRLVAKEKARRRVRKQIGSYEI